MNRFDMYFRQKVTEAEMDGSFDAVENAINRIFTDLGFVGVAFGMGVAQQVSPNMTVQVGGPGVAYDQVGQRIAIASTQNVNLAVDENALSTSVVTPGNERWLSIFAEFNRTLTDPRIDGNAVTVYYNRAESFVFNVAMGAEAGAGLGVRPSLRVDQILLADVLLVQGQTTVVNADISVSRREFSISIPDSPHSVGAATIEEALGQVLGFLNDHLTGAADKHAAVDINYAGGPAWLNGVPNPAVTVEVQIDKIITDLSNAASAGTDGVGMLGMAALGANWADATVPTVGTLRAFLVAMVTRLAATTGAISLGADALPNWADGVTNPAATIQAQLNRIVSVLADFVGTDDGAAKIGIGSGAGGFAWADGLNFANSNVRALFLKIVQDLASITTVGGSDRVGGVATTSTNTNPQVVIGAGPIRNQMQGANNYLHNAVNDAFYERVLNARFEQILVAAAVAGDGITCADWSDASFGYLAVRRVAAGDDQIYSGRGLDNGMTGTIRTITSTTIHALSCADQTGVTPILVGSRNPTSGGALLAYLSTPSTNTWTTVTLPAPATTSGAVLWDAVYDSFSSRWIVCGNDGTNAFFQYGLAAGTSFTTGTVTATASTPRALAVNTTDGTQVAVGSSGWVFYSGNGGTTWSRVQLGGGSPDFSGVCWNPKLNRFFAVANGAVYRSNDASGSAWTSISGSLPANMNNFNLFSIACDAEGRMVASAFNTVFSTHQLIATVDYFESARISTPPEGQTTAGGWVANNIESKVRYRRGRFMFGDGPTTGKGAIVSTRTVASLV